MKGTGLGQYLLIVAQARRHERSDLDRLVAISAGAFNEAAQYYDRLSAITVAAVGHITNIQHQIQDDIDQSDKIAAGVQFGASIVKFLAAA